MTKLTMTNFAAVKYVPYLCVLVVGLIISRGNGATKVPPINCAAVLCAAPNCPKPIPAGPGKCCPTCPPGSGGLKCPPLPPGSHGICVERCSVGSGGCPKGQLCCSNGCGHVCTVGVPSGKVTCKYNGKVYRPGTSFPSADGCNTCSCSTSGRVLCTKRACICPPNKPRVFCLVNPCRFARCRRYPFAKCVPYYCGGCHARFYFRGREVTHRCRRRWWWG